MDLNSPEFHELVRVLYVVALVFALLMLVYAVYLNRFYNRIKDLSTNKKYEAFKRLLSRYLLPVLWKEVFVTATNAILRNELAVAEKVIAQLSQQRMGIVDAQILTVLLYAKQGEWQLAQEKSGFLKELANDDLTKRQAAEIANAVETRDFANVSKCEAYEIGDDGWVAYPGKNLLLLRSGIMGAIILIGAILFILFK